LRRCAIPSGLQTSLLARLIDHAPLFPPARLPLPEALAEHRRARESSEGWIVRRFVCPASALASLNGEPLALSVVLDADVSLDDARVESVELPPNGVLGIVRDETYVEVAVDALPLFAPQLAASGMRAKVRCGPSVPDAGALAKAMHACRAHAVPFKATAGLHHAVRADGQHGFLNLLAAAIFEDEEAALAEDDPGAFRLDGDVFRWRDREASEVDVRKGRELFVAFGSCSFSEPVDELRARGFLAS
jgi:hypothetical protein